MVQRRLEYYSRQPPRPALEDNEDNEMGGMEKAKPVSFMDLPYEARRRVYILAGLVRFCPINMNQEGPRNEGLRTGKKPVTGYPCFYVGRRFFGRSFGEEFVQDCECQPVPVALLYVSRAVSEEVSHILYSENKFTISRSDLWGLRPLRNLSQKATASLRQLTLRFNNEECTFNFKFEDEHNMEPCHPDCLAHNLHDRPLTMSTRQGREAIEQWRSLVNTWGLHLEPGQLHLTFVCDTKDMATAQEMASITMRLPRLKTCAIRLGLKPNWDVRMLSQSTATFLTRPVSDDTVGARKEKEKRPSYYLPPEIITRILEYSDLVAPYDLEWRPDGGFPPYDCCKKCTSTLDCCTCSKFHASHSKTCTCWLPPMSLFLASRLIHDIAMRIFYGRNRFIALPRQNRMYTADFYWSEPERGYIWAQAPGAAHNVAKNKVPLFLFLQRIPQRAHRMIRYLGLRIPAETPSTHLPIGNGSVAWMHTKDLICENFDVGQLQLSLFFPIMFYAFIDDPVPSHDKYMEVYHKVLGQDMASRFKSLRNFFLYVHWPHPLETRARSLERAITALEKKILGDDYNSMERGRWSTTDPVRLHFDGREPENRTVWAPDGQRVWPIYDPDPTATPLSPPPHEYAYN